uniref:Uncharacterized protein n=1 Tax=Anguilla anguilla TaxID=7936 RepID=A0A0E9RV80_ANGAN
MKNISVLLNSCLLSLPQTPLTVRHGTLPHIEHSRPMKSNGWIFTSRI